MKIIEEKNTRIINIQYLDKGSVFTCGDGVYIISKVDFAKEIVEAFCLSLCEVTIFDFNAKVLHKPNATLILDEDITEVVKECLL